MDTAINLYQGQAHRYKSDLTAKQIVMEHLRVMGLNPLMRNLLPVLGAIHAIPLPFTQAPRMENHLFMEREQARQARCRMLTYITVMKFIVVVRKVARIRILCRQK